MKQILVLTVALMLSACAAGPSSQTFGARPDVGDRTIVLQGSETYALVRRAMMSAGWQVHNMSLAANAMRMRVKTTEELSAGKKSVEVESTDVNAKYLGEILATQTDNCIGLMGKSAGITPHYNPVTVSIYEIDTGALVFEASAGGCAEKAEKRLITLLREF